MPRRLLGFGIALTLAIGATGCGSSSGGDSTHGPPPSPPLTGAGSRLIVPLMSKWEGGYARETGERISYHAIHRDLAIGPVASDATDFGVLDAPLTPVQFGEAEVSIQMIPWALSGVAVAYNVKGAPKNLKLNSNVLADIFLGGITAWNDPAIARLNPDANLPDTPITPVYRTDESGEDYVFTDYLALTSEKFRSMFGISRNLRYPAGVRVRGEKSLAAKLARTDGAIGYLNLPYALSHGLDVALLENPAGNFAKPTATSLTAGAEAGIRLGPNNEVWLAELPPTAKSAYPLVTFSYAIVPVEAEEAAELKKFVSYAISPASQAFASALHFAPLPQNVIAADKRAAAAITR